MAWFNDFPTVTSVNDSDKFMIEQSGSTRNATLSTFKTFLSASSANLVNSDSTLAGTPASVTETTLRTFNLPAATLSVDGWFVRAIYFGVTALNGNSKTVRFKFGATTFTTGAEPVQGAWILESIIRRNSPGNQDMITRVMTKDGGTTWGTAILGYMQFQEPAENLNGVVAMELTGENGSAVASDIRYEGSIILLNS